MLKYRKFPWDRNCFFFFFTSSNNQQRNSMSSQSNRNWASTTPGKFLSSLLYLRSKPLVFLQALLNIQLLQNVWEGLRVSCTGLSVREQVPDSRSPTNNTLLGPSEALPLRAAAGSLCELPAVCMAPSQPSELSLTASPTPTLEPCCHIFNEKAILVHRLLAGARLHPTHFKVRPCVVLPPRGKREQRWLLDRAVIQRSTSVSNKCSFQHALNMLLSTTLLLPFGESSRSSSCLSGWLS